MEKKQIEMTLERARELYSSSSEEWKKVLEDNFGKSALVMDVRERVKTYEDACRE